MKRDVRVELRCPECGDGVLVERVNSKTGGRFMACDNWVSSDPPRGCQHTAPVPAFVYQLRAGAAPLPGFE